MILYVIFCLKINFALCMLLFILELFFFMCVTIFLMMVAKKCLLDT